MASAPGLPRVLLVSSDHRTEPHPSGELGRDVDDLLVGGDQSLGQKRVSVVVTISDDYTDNTTIGVMDGRFLVSFDAQTRKSTGRALASDLAT